MGPQGVPPDERARVDLLHDGDRARVTRLLLHGRTVIRKELLGPDVPRRRQHELAMLTRLRGVAGVAQLVDAPQYLDSIVLEDVGGTERAAQLPGMPCRGLSEAWRVRLGVLEGQDVHCKGCS